MKKLLKKIGGKNMKKIVIVSTILIICILIIALALLSVAYFKNTKKEAVRGQSIYGSGFNLTSCEEITEKDVYEFCLKMYNKNPEEFEAIMLTNKFHGHLGTNNVFGAKMALYAKKILNGENYKIKVLSEAGAIPPVGCLNDGIMAAINATFGRGLIENTPDSKNPNSSKLAATFYYGDKSVRLEVKPEIAMDIGNKLSNLFKKYGSMTDAYFQDVRNLSLDIWENSSEKDFIVTLSWDPECEYNDANVEKYYNALKDILKTAENRDEVLNFLAENKCVKDGSIKKEGDTTTIEAVWKSTGQPMTYKSQFLKF